MKHFKKKGFWVFYVALVLAGAFSIVALGLQNKSPVIPNVSAQEYGISPGDTIFGRGTPMSGISPHNVIFDSRATGISHPGDYAFYQSAYPDYIFDGDLDGETKMRTIMTCSGCSQTMSTCDWKCGPTFTQCYPRGGQGSMFGLYGGSNTSGICTGTYNTSGICIGTEYPTLSTCGIICGGGGTKTMMTCSGGLFGGCVGGGSTILTCGSGIACNWGPESTSSTCKMYGCPVKFEFKGSIEYRLGGLDFGSLSGFGSVGFGGNTYGMACMSWGTFSMTQSPAY